jgi:hypothetical protein
MPFSGHTRQVLRGHAGIDVKARISDFVCIGYLPYLGTSHCSFSRKRVRRYGDDGRHVPHRRRDVQYSMVERSADPLP